MVDLVAVDPRSVRRLLLGTNATAAVVSRAGFDDASRLRVRAEYLDDGYVRVRVDTATAVDVNLLEILREMSWTFYSLSQQRGLLENLDVALSTRASESTLSALSGKFPSAAALSDSLSNPTTTIVGDAMLGFDGTYWRRVRVDTSGRLRVVAESVANPPNLDAALSTRASESTLSSLRDRLLYPGDAETFTTTPLGANAAYYGPTRDFLYSRLTTFGVMGYANQPSASNGVYIQLSLDGSNWDYQGATTTLTAAGAVSLAQVVTARYARVVWVNGATAQTAFRLGGRYIIAGSENPPLSLAPSQCVEAVCSQCGKDMTETGDFFVEGGKVYCPKCYANKRWKEVADKREWVRSLKAWLKTAGEPARAKDHAPDAFLEVVG
jgi:hypothetical protein